MSRKYMVNEVKDKNILKEKQLQYLSQILQPQNCISNLAISMFSATSNRGCKTLYYFWPKTIT